ncbi:P-loop containing nucleoside triphosphate hydrolase protein [Mycena pura]|uniref:P-loop containing nucleoside triphosphate hydrolase protein n=1 Tax=Mycena pura TaxID=153505 RepID=A0AAD6YTB8_9AGAR|nr:P-loop containing nucleoside triphosphate hydrolase protein [Mycena pura]
MTGLDINMGSSQDTETSLSSRLWTVHVEVRLKPRATARFETIRARILDWVHSFDRINLASTLEGWEDFQDLASSVERVFVAESSCSSHHSLHISEMSLQIHVYQPADSDSFEEFTNSSGARGDEDETMAASVCELPNRGLEGLWDSLIYADDIKLKLLDYIHATLVLSDANVDFNLVSWNRVVLLHGPPGTGKTSLCRALAQKLSIRLSHRYSQARLLEINSHSLFSKWFSESGKLVQRLFTSITELVEEEDTFLVVLIDEVESLTAARAGALAGTEPSDGLRVVNALLTQLDKLKHRKNVLIMSTSNLVKAIDGAFVDRADVVQYIDLPSREAIYEILRTCLCEIMGRGIVSTINVPTLKQAQMYELSTLHSTDSSGTSFMDPRERSKNAALRILALAGQCRLKFSNTDLYRTQTQGMSGRALRRLPVLALARYIGIGYTVSPRNIASTANGARKSNAGADVDVWLDGMEGVVREQAKEQERLK